MTPPIYPLLAFGSLLSAIAAFWLAQVNAEAKLPYMDEYFHVRQALVYWSNQWHVWDPKITTPPGLYIVSYLGLLIGQWLPAESLLFQLRAHNVIGIWLTFVVVNQVVLARQGGDTSSAAHIAFNICTFPPLFFFSGLYYTDVMSVLVVMAAHKAFHQQKPLQVVVYSLLSLCFRQTNIFWTAIYLGGAEVVRQIKKNQIGPQSLSSASTITQVVSSSWSTSTLYDPPIADAFLQGLFPRWSCMCVVITIADYIKMVLSLATSATSLLQHLIVPLIPYICTLGAFAAFLVWNGGVVLGRIPPAFPMRNAVLTMAGDKESHIASLNLPQMLYIWPYMAFFSWPVLLPSLVDNIFMLLPSVRQTRIASRMQPVSDRTQIRIPIVLATLFLILLTVHYNTKIHPYLLADNRHYTFYVFRLLRNPLITYSLAPVYLFFAWACIGALSTPSTKISEPARSYQMTSSSLVLWTISSTLSLATAPLVEPRYFVLSWIIWRLDASSALLAKGDNSTTHPSSERKHPTNKEILRLEILVQWLSRISLLLETVWHLFLNIVIGYVFLKKTFTWPGAPEERMRFMW